MALVYGLVIILLMKVFSCNFSPPRPI